MKNTNNVRIQKWRLLHLPLTMLGFLVLFLNSQAAKAIVEIRGGYAINSGVASGFNSNFNNSALCTIATCKGLMGSAGLTGDVIFSPPLLKIGIGARYQSLSSSISLPLSSGDFKYTNNRLAVLVNYRLINTLVYFGPIATYGLSHTTNMNYSIAGFSADYTPDTNSSYSLGVEGGIKLGLFTVGTELGVLSLTSQNFKTKSLATLPVSNNFDVSMSGPYVNVLVGVAF